MRAYQNEQLNHRATLEARAVLMLSRECEPPQPSSSFAAQRLCVAIDRPHVHGDDLAVAHHDLAVDDGGAAPAAARRTALPPPDRAGRRHSRRYEVEREEVGALAGFERADVGASEHPRAAQRGELEHLAGRHPLVGAHRMGLRQEHVLARALRRQQAEPQPRQQHRLARLEQDVGGSRCWPSRRRPGRPSRRPPCTS